MANIIAVANQKGGVGKTTFCANLGFGLAQEGKKVQRSARLPDHQPGQRKTGHIINVSSTAARESVLPGVSVYYATKSAVKVASDGLRNEEAIAGSDIRVTNMSPGAIDANNNIHHEVMNTNPQNQTDSDADQCKNQSFTVDIFVRFHVAESKHLQCGNFTFSFEFQQEITKIIGQQHFSSMTEDQENSEYMFLFYASGSIGVIQKWLKDGMEKPAREMAELILKLSINGRAPFK